MTQETKLGLVIGGAFILCFALILSNTQDEGAVEEQIAALLSSGRSQPDVSELAGTGKAPHEIVNYTPRPTQPVSREEIRTPQLGSSSTETASKLGSSAPDQPNSPPDRKVIAQADGALEPELRQSPPPTTLPPPPQVTDVIANRPLSTPARGRTGVIEEAGGPPQADNNPKAAAPGPVSTDPPHTVTTKPSEPQPRRVQTYVVGKEDTLSRIARKFYGQATAQNIDLIFRSNRASLASRDSLHVGQNLEIPLTPTKPHGAGIAETVSALTEAQATKSAPGEKKASPAPPKEKWEWYQVKSKDRYASIAQEKLGDKKRWKEIFELNKDVFPDPNQIRSGVRIKIPR